MAPAPVLLAALALGWLVLLVIAPVAPTPIATVLYAAGSFICHQRSERSFHVDGAQLPVCARCLGVYAGAAIGSLGCLVPGFDLALRPRAVLLLGLLPTLVTIGLEVSGLWSVGNVVRGAAGLPLGLAAAFVLAPRLRVHY